MSVMMSSLMDRSTSSVTHSSTSIPQQAGDMLARVTVTKVPADQVDNGDGGGGGGGGGGGADHNPDMQLREVDAFRPVKFCCRLYVIGCQKLTAKDSGPFVGKSSDPYIVMTLTNAGSDKDDLSRDAKDQVKYQTLDPDYFLMLELEGQFPKHNTLRVEVYDKDKISSDDVIGYTDINIEQRWYSRRGHSGLGATTMKPGTYTEKRTLKDSTGRNQVWI